MYCGVYQNFTWEISNGELIITSRPVSSVALLRQPVTSRFNNAEQATWFAQGQIDMQLEQLQHQAAVRQAPLDG